MLFEVEQKFRVPDWERVAQKLRSMGATMREEVAQEDYYFQHPARDFTVTDEALRIRRVGSNSWVTYKGPKIDTTSKTRQEIELPISDEDSGAARFAQLLAALGFCSVASVCKKRRTASLQWQGFACEVALDDVDQLGRFVELDFLVPESEMSRARDALQSLGRHLELDGDERRSYLELLLQRTND